MIDPNAISTIRVGQLVEAPFNLTDNIPHEVGTDLRRGTIADLSTFIAGIIGSTDSLAFLPISVTDGQTLPDTTTNEWFLAGKGTYTQTGGFPDIVCTEELNAIVGNGTNWILGVEIPITVDPPSSMISQTVNAGVVNYSPSENAVYQAIQNMLSSLNFPKRQFTADGIQTTFDLTTLVLAKAVFWNGALLDDSDWSQSSNILTLTFAPAVGEIIKPI